MGVRFSHPLLKSSVNVLGFFCISGKIKKEVSAMKQLQILIKPASSACNLRCRYCFYEDESNCREIKNYGIMSAETRSDLIENALSSAEEQIGRASCRERV